MEYLTVTEAREQLTKLDQKLKRAKRGYVIITRHGKPLFRLSLVRKRRYVSEEEMSEILNDPNAMAAISSAEEDFKAGRYKSLEQVLKERGL